MGLTLTYGLFKFPNFPHTEFMVIGAYVGYSVTEQLGWAFPFSFIFAFLSSGLLGTLSYRATFQPLLNQGATIIHLMVAAIAEI